MLPFIRPRKWLYSMRCVYPKIVYGARGSEQAYADARKP